MRPAEGGLLMPLSIRRSVLEAMIVHARRDMPNEACGYLAQLDGIIVEAIALRNADASPEHFSFVPQEQFDTVRSLRGRGLRATGVYHSHPSTPARPSPEDIRLAGDPGVSYVIVSLAPPQPEVKSFRIAGGIVTEEEITIV